MSRRWTRRWRPASSASALSRLCFSPTTRSYSGNRRHGVVAAPSRRLPAPRRRQPRRSLLWLRLAWEPTSFRLGIKPDCPQSLVPKPATQRRSFEQLPVGAAPRDQIREPYTLANIHFAGGRELVLGLLTADGDDPRIAVPPPEHRPAGFARPDIGGIALQFLATVGVAVLVVVVDAALP